MKIVAMLLVPALCFGVIACNKRTATVDTGTGKATVTTEAPKNLVSESQLQTQANIAATGVSKPVDGSGPVSAVTPTQGSTPGK